MRTQWFWMIALSCCLYGSADEVEEEECASYEELVEDRSEDKWFGPGYYYGTWFATQDDYEMWRETHADYPPNREYYSRHHPIEYKP